MQSKRIRCGDNLRGEFLCKPSDNYAQIQCYTLQRARILQRMSVRLRAYWGPAYRYQAISMPFAGTLIKDAGGTLRLPTSRDPCTELLQVRYQNFRFDRYVPLAIISGKHGRLSASSATSLSHLKRILPWPLH